MSCIVLLRSFLLSYNRVVRSEVFMVLLDAPAEANMHLYLFQCVSHYLPRCTKAFLSHQHSGRVFQGDQDNRFTDDIDATHFPSRVKCFPLALTNPGLSECVGPEALTRLRDVNRVASNQTMPM